MYVRDNVKVKKQQTMGPLGHVVFLFFIIHNDKWGLHFIFKDIVLCKLA